MARKHLAIFLVLIFCAMSCLPFAQSSPNKEVDVDIGIGPNGISDQYTVSVQDGKIVSNISLKLSENPWPVNEVTTWNENTDWASGYSMDGIDYNSSGLRVLPMSYEWDFEGSVQGWNLDTQGGWAHGYDSSLGSVSGVKSGTSAIYTYNGNYPNYMGGPYWATSPIIDCSACSGTWDLKFWKRLGVESSSYDRAYVSVKNGNNWVNVYSNPYGTTNDNSYIQSSYDVSNYIRGNSAFQVRFGLGTTDGSVTYTGWNVDDVTLEPRGNTGTGMANWTSQSFGPEGLVKAKHGMMSIDATVTTGSSMKWTLIDANDGSIIPGFENREDMQADLSIIDEVMHPSVRLRLTMESTGESPVINSIKVGGGIIESFSTNPSQIGWSGFTSHSNGVVSGTNSLQSPEWRFNTPYSGIQLDWISTGSGNLQACFLKLQDCLSSGWVNIPSNGKYELNYASVFLNLRWQGSGSYTFDELSVDLHRQSSPTNTRIDIGLDGVYEWTNSHEFVGPWGIQNLFTNGRTSMQANLSSGFSESFYTYFPYSSSQSLPNVEGSNYESAGAIAFTLIPKNHPMSDVEISLNFDGNNIFSQSLGIISQPVRIELSDSQMNSLFQGANTRTAEIDIVSDLQGHELEIAVTSSTDGPIIASGLSIPYRYDAQISTEESMAIVSAINAQLSQASSKSGLKTISIPVIMDNPGSVLLKEFDLQTILSPMPLSIEMTNQTDTLVAGNNWYEFSSTFDLSNLQVSNAQTHFSSEGWSSIFVLSGTQWTRSVHCNLTGATCMTDQGVILNNFSFEFDGSKVTFFHRLQISSLWPDEEALIISSSIDMAGVSSQPAQIRFGSGWSMGVEQDIDVVDWYLSFSEESRSDWEAKYFDPSNPCVVKIEFAFEDLEDYPRSSSVKIDLFSNGILVDTTTEILDGIATLECTFDSSTAPLDLSLQVTPFSGQNVIWKVPSNATFVIDDVSPVLISSNVNTLDHRDSYQPLYLSFEIGDRPVLPRHAILQINSTWAGQNSIELNLPADLNVTSGEYSTILDLTGASVGDSVSGWLEVYDPAGHHLEGSGSVSEPLFMIQLGPDGSPSVIEENFESTTLSGWLHPNQNYSLNIPLHDINGYGDINEISIDLSTDLNDNLLINWSPSDGCTSSTTNIIVQSCAISPNTHHFDAYFDLEVVFSLGWAFNPDSSIERRSMVSVTDDSGQSYTSVIGTSWRYSSEMEIDTSSVNFSDSSAFVAPGETNTLSAEVIWSKSMKPVTSTVEIVAFIDTLEQYGISQNGKAEILLTAPELTGIHPITLDIINLPAGGIDRTDEKNVVAWIVVDGHIPKVSELLSPNPELLVQERDWNNLVFEVLVNETQGLDIDTMKLQWMLLPQGIAIPEFALLSGNQSMSLIAGTGAGISIPLFAVLDIDSKIPEISRDTSWDLWVWVEGEDFAGQQIDSSFNSRINPLAIFQLANREPHFNIDSDDIVISTQYPSIDNPVMINVTVQNTGMVTGSTRVNVEVIEDGNQRRLIDSIMVSVPSQSSVSFNVKWIPEYSGASWVEVTTPDGISERTLPLQVDEGDSEYVIEGLEGASTPMLTGFGIIVFLMVGLLGYLIISNKEDEHDDDFD